jgi:hypothetical protein
MSLSEIKEKTNWTHVVIGVSSSLLTLAIVAVVAVCFCGFRYRNIVLLNSEQVVKEEVQSTVTIPEAELLTQLHQKGILMTPAEYTGHLATYYDTLVAFLAVFFVIFSIFGYLGVRSMSRKEVAQVAKDVVADSYELRTGIKSMIMGEIDENMVHAEDYDATIAEINERLDKCVYAEDPLPEQKMTIADPKELKKNGSKRKKNSDSPS